LWKKIDNLLECSIIFFFQHGILKIS
jgi:hypothetical protein